jgi:hypothetical protein
MTPKKKKHNKTASRRGGDPANLEKSRGRTKQHLVPGRKPEKTLTIPELEYCGWRARGATIADSGRFAGIRPGNVYALEHRDLTQETIEHFKTKHKDSAIDRVDALREDLVLFVFGEFQRRLRTMKTHHFRGDDSVVRALDTGFKACGLIQPAKITAQANAGARADVSNQLYAKRLYLPDWRRENIERVEREGTQAPQ